MHVAESGIYVHLVVVSSTAYLGSTKYLIWGDRTGDVHDKYPPQKT